MTSWAAFACLATSSGLPCHRRIGNRRHARREGTAPAIAAADADLPATFHRDPADRIIVATAHVLGAMLLTNDGRIRDADIVRTL
jgi:PIN domain nuclease of toxin-antitoxin system